MKKILYTATVDKHIISFHIPYLKMLKEMGYEVHVATNGTEQIAYCDVKHTVTFERNPFKINNIKAIYQLKKIIENEKFDLIHCHTPMGSAVTRFAAKNARKNGTRVIYTAHGFHFFKGAPILNWLLFYPVEKYLSKYTDTIITINNEDFELARKKFKRVKIEYVPGIGIDPKKFNFEMTEEEKIRLREEVGCEKDDFVIICIGELNKNKNQIMAIKALNEVIKQKNNVKLLIVGEGLLKQKYENVINKLGLEKSIKLLGYRTDVSRLIKISDLGVSCSKREGLPVNILEMLFCNLPVIATNNRGHRDLIEEEKLIFDNKYISLSDRIIYLINNLKVLIINKKLKHYELNNLINKIKNIYKI